jgi:hypothetical protein
MAGIPRQMYAKIIHSEECIMKMTDSIKGAIVRNCNFAFNNLAAISAFELQDSNKQEIIEEIFKLFSEDKITKRYNEEVCNRLWKCFDSSLVKIKNQIQFIADFEFEKTKFLLRFKGAIRKTCENLVLDSN